MSASISSGVRSKSGLNSRPGSKVDSGPTRRMAMTKPIKAVAEAATPMMRAPRRRLNPDTPRISVLEIVEEPTTVIGATQLDERLRLDLSNPLTGDVERPGHLLESSRLTVVESEAHT